MEVAHSALGVDVSHIFVPDLLLTANFSWQG